MVTAIPTTAAQPATRTALAVGDNLMVRRFVARIIRQAGRRVLEGSTAGEGLALAAAISGPFDLVLTDAEMPVMAGMDMVCRLAHGRKDLRVLFLTASGAVRLECPRVLGHYELLEELMA